MKPHISISGVSKIYGVGGPRDLFRSIIGDVTSIHAVKGVSLEIAAGERVGVIGVNGSGKSTLLQMMSGVSQPTVGDVHVEGEICSLLSLGPVLREELTGRQNIMIDAELRGQSRESAECLIDEIIAFADIGGYIDMPMRTYSTGMKSRLAFSMSVFASPEILIIDEALSVGDVTFVSKAAAKVKAMCGEGVIVVFVSHNMASIMQMCRRCIWMENGAVEMDGPAVEVVDAYRRNVDRLSSLPPAASGTDAREVSVAVSGPPDADGVRRVSIDLALLNEEQGRDLRIGVTISTLDGMPIIKKQSELDVAGGQNVLAKSISLRLDPFPLANGRYLLHIQLAPRRGPVSEICEVIELSDLPLQVGGEPLLNLPSKVSSVRL